ANWEGVYQNANAIGGFSGAMTNPYGDACVVVPRVLLGSADFGGTVGIRLSASRPGTVTYLNAAASNTQQVAGGLANIDIANVAPDDGQTSYFFGGATPIQAFVQFVTDGCNQAGASKRTFSPVYSVSVKGTGTAPPGPRVYARREGPLATFAWDVPADAK